MDSRETLHRLMYLAFLEMRIEAHSINNTAIFHIADLLHTVPLSLERAAKSEVSYDEVLAALEARSREKGCQQWFESVSMEASQPFLTQNEPERRKTD